LDWREVRPEGVGEFVAWLRLPPTARTGPVAVLPSVEHHCGETTMKWRGGRCTSSGNWVEWDAVLMVGATRD
jgi:hypothetical protein